MGLILDTCTFMWVVSAEQRLPRLSRDLIADPANQILVSAATARETESTLIGQCPLTVRW